MAVGPQADVVVVVDVESSTSQPRTMLLVESTCVAVVWASTTPNEVVVTNIVADAVSQDVGSSELRRNSESVLPF